MSKLTAMRLLACNCTIISMAELHTIDGRVKHFYNFLNCLHCMYECIVSVCRHTSKYMCEWLIHAVPMVRLYHLQLLYAKKVLILDVAMIN